MSASYGITAPTWDEPEPEAPGAAVVSELEEPIGDLGDETDFEQSDDPEEEAPAAVTDPSRLREARQRGDRAREIMESVQLRFLTDVKFEMDSSEPEYAAGLWLCLTYEALTKAFDAQVAEAVAKEVTQLSRESAQAVARVEVASRSAVARIDAACARLEELSIKAARSAQEVDAMLRSNTGTLAAALGGHTQTLLDQTRGCMSGLASELQKAPEARASALGLAPDTLLQSVVKKLFGIA